MAKDKVQTITAINVNNSKSTTTVTKTVEQVVVNGRLVPEDKDINPGVIVGGS